MLGFTYAETETYLRYVLDKYVGSQDRYDEIWQLIVNNYDGYQVRMLPSPIPAFITLKKVRRKLSLVVTCSYSGSL